MFHNPPKETPRSGVYRTNRDQIFLLHFYLMNVTMNYLDTMY